METTHFSLFMLVSTISLFWSRYNIPDCVKRRNVDQQITKSLALSLQSQTDRVYIIIGSTLTYLLKEVVSVGDGCNAIPNTIRFIPLPAGGVPASLVSGPAQLGLIGKGLATNVWVGPQ